MIFVPQKNEMYYDLGGALGFLSTTFVSLYYPTLREKYILGRNTPLPPLSSFAGRQLLVSGCLVLWSSRLGTFLLSVSASNWLTEVYMRMKVLASDESGR